VLFSFFYLRSLKVSFYYIISQSDTHSCQLNGAQLGAKQYEQEASLLRTKREELVKELAELQKLEIEKEELVNELEELKKSEIEIGL
jgi:cell shape-determining protein MreC